MSYIITVDGPSGAGKGTLCHALAEKLKADFLDSGAIYRITALAAVKKGISLDDEVALAKLGRQLDIRFEPKNGEVNVILDGENVGDQIRTAEAGQNASKVAALPQVRAALLQRQRDFASSKGLVADGRDFRDRNREVAPLVPAADALLLDSTHLSIDEVIAQALGYISSKGIA